MTLIKSISGIRGTIGGNEGDNLTPIDVVRFASAYGQWVINRSKNSPVSVVIGRDARQSGEMVNRLVSATLQGLGINVIDLGLSTTPTVEMLVEFEGANGGIIITASHNPAQWNALKLLNEKGEFISGSDGAEVLDIAEKRSAVYAPVEKLGTYRTSDNAIQRHIDAVLELPAVDRQAIADANFSVAVDAVNSTGGISLLPLLEQLGVKTVYPLYCEPSGDFPHNPEPLAENLTEIAALVREKKADLGIVVDPDVDRLALITERGEMFGEEYTIVAIADYILSREVGNTVSNLSSSRALADVTERHGGKYAASAVGEVNVVDLMKESKAIIGGEGNGGVIYPELHYGRDALVGVALFLTHLAKSKKTVSELRAGYPAYFMSKNKIELQKGMDVDAILKEIHEQYEDQRVTDIDGVKIDFDHGWVHLRKSNTEPIIRVYSEGQSQEVALQLANEIIDAIEQIIG